MKKATRNILILIILMPALLLLPYFIVPVLNNIKADRLAKEMRNAPVPEQTEVVEVIAGCGNTGGTGNHTEIWIGMLVKSELSQEELTDFYKQWQETNGKTPYIRVENAKEERGSEYSFILSLLQMELRSMRTISDYTGYYVVGVTENAVSSSFDLRGH